MELLHQLEEQDGEFPGAETLKANTEAPERLEKEKGVSAQTTAAEQDEEKGKEALPNQVSEDQKQPKKLELTPAGTDQDDGDLA